MKKFTNLKWLSDSLANAGRFIYFTSKGGDAPQDEAAPQPETPLDTETPPTPEEVHDQNLDALRTAQDQGELAVAAALETALDSLGTQYEGKAQDSISNGQQELRDLLTSMGVEEKEMEDILGQYGTVFEDTIYTWGGKDEKLQSANESQRDDKIVELKNIERTRLNSEHTIEETELNDKVVFAKKAMDGWEGRISNKENYSRGLLESGLSGKKRELKLVAEEYELGSTDYETLSAMGEDGMIEKVSQYLSNENPNWNLDYPSQDLRDEICRRYITKYIKPRLEDVKAAQDRLRDFDSELEEDKRKGKWWADRYTELNQNLADMKGAHQKESGMVEDGTYVLASGNTITEEAQAYADTTTSDKEAQIYEEYAAKAQGKTKELVHTIMKQRLDKRIKEIEESLDVDNEGSLVAQINQRESLLEEEVETAKNKLETQISNFELDDLADVDDLMVARDEDIKKDIEKGIREQNSEDQLMVLSAVYKVNTVDEAVAIMVKNRYDALISGTMKDYQTAQAQLQTEGGGGDEILRGLRSEESSTREALAALRRQKASYDPPPQTDVYMVA